MALEIERKFLVHRQRLPLLENGTRIVQGFIPTRGFTAVRVRMAGDRAWLTLKGRTRGATRLEYEYSIPGDDAREILEELCPDERVEKTRYLHDHAGHTWEIDVFEGDNAVLIVAEVELGSRDEQPELPPWVATEVTDDPRYYNSELAKQPHGSW